MAGGPAPLVARALDLLQVLSERAGQLVSKHDLMDLVWPGVVAEENSLAAQISAPRKVLGGDVIATIPGRSYRFTTRIYAAELPAEDRGLASRVEPVRGDVSEHGTAIPAPTAPPTSAPVASPTNLPAKLSALLGRADDVAAMGTLIDRHRLVSIVGAGGMGKTLLAQHLLGARRSAYPLGVCWVELTRLSPTPLRCQAPLGRRWG